jgi:hypothetical protein
VVLFFTEAVLGSRLDLILLLSVVHHFLYFQI